MNPLLTIAVPTYNMECCLEKNLRTYLDKRLEKRVEVLCVNNGSEDHSKKIIEDFCKKAPDIFTLIDKENHGYGSSINIAIAKANGKYFRVVDADDWVDTDELVKMVDKLEDCSSDLVLTDYTLVDLKTGRTSAVCARRKGVEYETVFFSLKNPIKTLPSIHATTYRTAMLRENAFRLQEEIFFVDEEFVILPYLYVKSLMYLPLNIYQYQISNPNQSTSPENRGRYQEHREKVLRRLLDEYVRQKQNDNGEHRDALKYCYERIRRGVGDHFTTLYMYIENRKEGRRLASCWKQYLKQNAPSFWRAIRRKSFLLLLLNSFHISLAQYEWFKCNMRPILYIVLDY